MKKLFLAAVAVMITAFSANAQVRVESPHPDLDIKIKRCAYASGTVVIDILATNYGPDETIKMIGSGSTSAGNDRSNAYDDEGNIYDNTNSQISVGPLGNIGANYPPDINMPQDVPIKLRIEITNVDPNATKFALINLKIHSHGAMKLDGHKRPLKIRNLEWAK